MEVFENGRPGAAMVQMYTEEELHTLEVLKTHLRMLKEASVMMCPSECNEFAEMAVFNQFLVDRLTEGSAQERAEIMRMLGEEQVVQRMETLIKKAAATA